MNSSNEKTDFAMTVELVGTRSVARSISEQSNKPGWKASGRQQNWRLCSRRHCLPVADALSQKNHVVGCRLADEIKVLLVHLLRRLGGSRHVLAGNNKVDDEPKGKHVGTAVDNRPLANEDAFWRAVVDRVHFSLRLSGDGNGRPTRQSKVGKLGVGANQNVGWLDVAVDDASAVKIHQPLDNVVDDGVFVNVFCCRKRRADVLHDNVCRCDGIAGPASVVMETSKESLDDILVGELLGPLDFVFDNVAASFRVGRHYFNG